MGTLSTVEQHAAAVFVNARKSAHHVLKKHSLHKNHQYDANCTNNSSSGRTGHPIGSIVSNVTFSSLMACLSFTLIVLCIFFVMNSFADWLITLRNQRAEARAEAQRLLEQARKDHQESVVEFQKTSLQHRQTAQKMLLQCVDISSPHEEPERRRKCRNLEQEEDCIGKLPVENDLLRFIVSTSSVRELLVQSGRREALQTSRFPSTALQVKSQVIRPPVRRRW